MVPYIGDTWDASWHIYNAISGCRDGSGEYCNEYEANWMCTMCTFMGSGNVSEILPGLSLWMIYVNVVMVYVSETLKTLEVIKQK